MVGNTAKYFQKDFDNLYAFEDLVNDGVKIDDIYSTAKCIKVTEENGSWRYLFEGNSEVKQLVVYKGSICINGVSLTVTKTMNQEIEVAIIPYTYEHTNFQQIQVGDLVNIEFDILGKYFLKNAKNLTGLQ